MMAAVDPGLGRLRIATAATVSMLVALVAVYGYSLLVRPSIGVGVPMIIAAVAAMQGSGALMQPRRRQRLQVALWQPVAVGIGLVINVLTRASGAPGIELVMFAGVTFAAVFVRRYGAHFVLLGLMGWTGYFIAAFAEPTLADVPFLLSVVVIACTSTLVLSLTLWGHRPRQALRHSLWSWEAQAANVIRAASRTLNRAPNAAGPRRMRNKQAQLANTTLLVEGWLSHVHVLPNASDDHHRLRRWLLRAQSALDVVVNSVDALSRRHPNDEDVTTIAVMLADLNHGDASSASAQAQQLLLEDTARQAPYGPTTQLAEAVSTLLSLGPLRSVARTVAVGEENFSPVVVLAPGGALTGTAGVIATVAARGPRHLQTLSLTTRQALQATVAVIFATFLGYLISPTQVTWAVLAVFIVFLGTGTRGETAVKAVHRMTGTLAGIIVAVPVSALLGGNPVAVVVLALVACALAHYFAPFSYSYMMFFITVVVLQMYDMMHQFSFELLRLRLAETVLGAAIALVVSGLLVPIATRDTYGHVRGQYFDSAARLLDAIADRIDHVVGGFTDTQYGFDDLQSIAREADEHARRLAVAAAPLTLLPGRRSKQIKGTLEDYAQHNSYLRQLTVYIQGLERPLPASAAVEVRILAQSARRLESAASRSGGGGQRMNAIAANVENEERFEQPFMRHFGVLRDSMADLHDRMQ